MRIFGSVGIGPFRFGASENLRRRKRARYWTHPGCQVHHTRQDTANACARRMARR
jgi:hypothetical protein